MHSFQLHLQQLSVQSLSVEMRSTCPIDDQFEFSVHDYDERRYQLRFPNDTTGFCPDLERLLHELLGPEAVDVRPL